jgi:hypothetical protein
MHGFLVVAGDLALSPASVDAVIRAVDAGPTARLGEGFRLDICLPG